MKVAKKTDHTKAVRKVAIHNATIVIKQWAAEDDKNETCIVKGFKKVSDGSVRRKKLIARLYKEVYVKLPPYCVTKDGSRQT